MKFILSWNILIMMCLPMAIAACSTTPAGIVASPTTGPSTEEYTPTIIAPTSTMTVTAPAPTPPPTVTELSERPRIQPVDANQDGKIDAEDVLLLLDMSNKYWDEKIMPLLAKAGIETDEDGNIISKNATQMIKEKLTASEQHDLDTALDEYELYSAKVDATLLEAFQNR